jgi:hypothetical protein
MGRPRKKPMNGDSKIIYDAVAKLQGDVTTIMTDVASEIATRGEQHTANLRALETMSGDMHIVLSKVQSLGCSKHEANIKSLNGKINWVLGIFATVIAAALVMNFIGK